MSDALRQSWICCLNKVDWCLCYDRFHAIRCRTEIDLTGVFCSKKKKLNASKRHTGAIQPITHTHCMVGVKNRPLLWIIVSDQSKLFVFHDSTLSCMTRRRKKTKWNYKCTCFTLLTSAGFFRRQGLNTQRVPYCCYWPRSWLIIRKRLFRESHTHVRANIKESI